jgi:rfaE bifunctional protein kinase chain/domain
MEKRFHRAIEQMLKEIPNRKIAVIGDFFLDNYLLIDPNLAEISLETGKTANQVVQIKHSPGAAGSVTSNLSAIGVGEIFAIGAIGEDGAGYDLIQDLKKTRVDCRYLVRSTEMFTPTYTKPMKKLGERLEEQERLDIKNRKEIHPEIENQILANIETCFPQIDGFIVADQVEEPNCGVITDRVRARLIEFGEKYPDKVIFADSRARINQFSNIIIKPNKFEAYFALHGKRSSEVTRADVEIIGQKLTQKTNKPVVITLEKEGALMCQPGKISHIPGIPVAGEIDTVGAGDSFSAGFVSALCTGAELDEAAYVGNIVASITITKIGTTGTATPAEIRQRNLKVEQSC